MRVELPTPNPAPRPEAPAVQTDTPPTGSKSRAPVSPLEQFARGITRPRNAWTLATITVLLFTWSLVIRQPLGERYLAVSARAQAISGAPIEGTNITNADLELLRREVSALKSSLVSSRKEILPLLFSLETQARKEGWRCERSMMPAQTFASTLPNLELHPVVFRLSPTTALTPGLYTPLLRWMQSVSQIDKRAEIASLHIEADASGIQRADVRIHFFSLNRNEETAPK